MMRTSIGRGSREAHGQRVPSRRRYAVVAVVTALLAASLSATGSKAAFALPVLIVPATGHITGNPTQGHCVDGSKHNGVDIARWGGSSTVVSSAGSGVVTSVVNSSGSTGFGTHVVVDLGSGYTATYGHLVYGSVAVAQGSTVSAGQQIGTMGSTGNSTGVHLHFELRLNGSVPAGWAAMFPCGADVARGSTISGSAAGLRGPSGLLWTSADVPVIGDWDANGTDDVGVARSNTFYTSSDSGATTQSAIFGNGLPAGDVPLVGDWNGDGTSDLGIVRTNQFILQSGSGYQTTLLGNGIAAGDIPLAGDWNGDGRTDIGIARGSSFQLYVNGVSYRTFLFGNGYAAGDVPIVGDWNGDGSSDIGISRGNTFIEAVNGGTFRTLSLGSGVANGDIPVIGDWDGNGVADVGIWRGNTLIKSAPATNGSPAIAGTVLFGDGCTATF